MRALFEQVRRHDDVIHELLDTLPASRTLDYVRGLLVEHGALPCHNVYRYRFNAWVPGAIERLEDPDDREVITRLIRRHLLRRMNETDVTSRGTFLRAKQTVTVAIDLVTWLRARGIALADLDQIDLDAWQAGGTTTRGIASRFLGCAIKTRLITPDLRLTPHRRDTSRKLGAQEQAEAMQEYVHSTDMPARHRAIAILLLIFGQPIERISALTWDVDIVSHPATIRLCATAEIELHPPLDELFCTLAAQPRNHQTAAHPRSKWVFPGYSPGRPLDPGYIAGQLRGSVGARAARLGTLHELTKLAPTAVIAEVHDREARPRLSSAANYAYIQFRPSSTRMILASPKASGAGTPRVDRPTKVTRVRGVGRARLTSACEHVSAPRSGGLCKT